MNVQAQSLWGLILYRPSQNAQQHISPTKTEAPHLTRRLRVSKPIVNGTYRKLKMYLLHLTY